MSYREALQTGPVKIGTKQTLKMVELGKAVEVFVAKDADPRITQRVLSLCNKSGIKVTTVESMKKLGKACGIDVGAAMAVITKE